MNQIELKYANQMGKGVACKLLVAKAQARRPWPYRGRSIRDVAIDLYRAGLSRSQVADHIWWVGCPRGMNAQYMAQEMAKARKLSGYQEKAGKP